MSIPTFVARANQVQRLQQFLDQARAGQGQVVFVAGEAGSGKTALINEFVRQAQEKDATVVAAMGQCNAQTGAGDAYLPFREVLTTLLDAQDDHDASNTLNATNATRLQSFARISGETLLEVAPDLVGIFVPGASLIAKIVSKAAQSSKLAEKLSHKMGNAAKSDTNSAIAPELDQEKIFQQYARALQALAVEHPLIVILDDLHWADGASLNLLFHLARQLRDSRVLLLGAYRPADVALGRGGERHPLEPLLNELRRYQGDIVVNLNEINAGEGRAFVDDLVDAEPNLLGETFRQELFTRTEGHPLFTVEMLRTLQERHSVVKDGEGRWVQDETLDWSALPARVDGVIEERMDRLADELRETLNIASVVGSQFAAQVVAHVQQAQERELLKWLARDLDKRHHLVNEVGETKIGSQFLSLFRFSHALFQQFLYNELSASERRLLHGDVADALEALYAGNTGAIAVPLAHHYIEAGNDERAAEYHIRAGDESKRVYAAAEARLHYLDALVLLKGLPDTLDIRRFRFETMLKFATLALGSVSPYQLLANLLEAESLGKSLLEAKRPSDLASLAYLRIELARLYITLNQPFDGLACCDQALRDAEELGDEGLRLWATAITGVAKLDQGEFAVALQKISPAVSYLEQAQNWREWVWTKMNVAFAYAGHGEFHRALEQATQCLQRAHETQDNWMIGAVHLFLAHVYWAGGDIAHMLVEARTLVQIAEQKQELNFLQLGLLPQMWAESKLGDHEAAAQSLERRNALIEGVGVEIVWADWGAAARAEMALNAGRLTEAIALAEQAVKTAQSVGGKLAAGLAERTWAEALAASAQCSFSEVEDHLAASLLLFEQGEAYPEAARTHFVWGKLLQAQGEKAAARQHFEKATALFEASGLEPELQAARTLVDAGS